MYVFSTWGLANSRVQLGGCLYIQDGHVESLYMVCTTLVVVISLERVESLLEVIRVHSSRDHLLAALLLLLSDLGPIQSRGDVGQLQVKGYAQLVWGGTHRRAMEGK